MNNLDEEYQISVYRGIRSEAERLGMELVCAQAGGNRTFFSFIENLAMDGILILSSALLSQPLSLRDFSSLPGALKTVPVVSIGNRLRDFPAIIVKNRTSMESLMEHLISPHGYRKFLYIGGPVNHPDNQTREHIFRKSINALRARLPQEEQADIWAEVLNGAFHAASGQLLLRDYIASGRDIPDVIVAANDNMAIGIQEVLRAQSELCWRRCGVTGFDDIPLARLETPALTTVRQPLGELGIQAVRVLWDAIQGKPVPPVTHIESEVKFRASCGCAGIREDEQSSGSPRFSDLQFQSVRSENYLRNVSYLGQSLLEVVSVEQIFPSLRYFLTNLNIPAFYLIFYPEPSPCPEAKGILLFQQGDFGIFGDNKPALIDLSEIFARTVTDTGGAPRAWCLYHLRSGSEYLGLILYQADDSVHPHICSAALFIANTVKRLRNEETKLRLVVETEVSRISELERLRFSMDLHDDICQRLAGISMFCRGIASGLSPETLIPELADMIDETLSRTRQYAHESFPVELDAFGLNEALDTLCHNFNKQQTACHCVYTWSVPETSPLTHIQDINVYRIVQEALANAAKHARASSVRVEVKQEKRFLVIRVKDNGAGNSLLNGEEAEQPALTPSRRRAGLGLRSMRYRAQQLGAEYVFTSSETGGTLVELKIPADGQEGAL